ncbi:MAG: S-methyl-5-thioribose-1-phosphate isomerase, partial [Bacteroidota bacterium]
RVNAVVVGADRITVRGDVANKVGTYGLAVMAKHHRIPFYVAAPVTTVDVKMKAGSEIPIEQRSPAELTEINGIPLAPEGTETYSPAFDVTPASLITAIITDRGPVFPPFEEIFGKPEFQADGTS